MASVTIQIRREGGAYRVDVDGVTVFVHADPRDPREAIGAQVVGVVATAVASFVYRATERRKPLATPRGPPPIPHPEPGCLE